jgi:CheY-like chemotaxis protein
MLKEHGYAMITATHGSHGLRLLMSQSVDAVVLEYYLGLLDGAAVAEQIKQVKPRLPIVMLADHMDFPGGALNSVDALVAESDGPRLLLATINSVLQTNQSRQHDGAYTDEATPPVGEALSDHLKGHILVVDDEASVRESIARLLISKGYDVVVAEDGFRALSQLRKTLPDVIVSDLDMPGMSGFELLSVVRRRFPEISTVAMSGAYDGDELPFGVIADGFFAKGGQFKNLVSTIQGLLHTAPARSHEHLRECAPAWIPRNENDSQGMPYVVLTCAQCLRAFSMNVTGRSTTGEVLEIPCRFCPSTNRYIIQPSSRDAPDAFA